MLGIFAVRSCRGPRARTPRQALLFGIVVGLCVVGLAAVLIAGQRNPARASAATRLVMFTHYEKVPPMDGLSRAADEWNQLHPDIHVEHQIVPFDGTWYEKLATQVAAGQTPDILHIPNIYLADLIGQGIIAPVPDSVIKSVIEPDYVPGALIFTRYQGKVWGIPTEFQPRALAYNSGLFEAAGLPDRVPRDWDEMTRYAQKITQRNADGTIKVAGFGLWTATWAVNGFMGAYLALAWSNGADIFAGADGRQLNLTGTRSQEALQLLADLNTKYKVMALQTAGYQQDKLGMFIAFGPWERGLYLRQPGNWYKEHARSGIIPPGRTGNPVAPTYGWMFAVSRTCKNPQAAWQFLTWLNTAAVNGTTRMGNILAQQGSIPVTRQDLEAQATIKEPFMKGFVEALMRGYIRPDPIIPLQDRIFATIHSKLLPAVQGQVPVAQALTQAEQAAYNLWKQAKL